MTLSIKIRRVLNWLTKTILQNQYFILFLIILAIAFYRNLQSIKGLMYSYDTDSERDLGNVQNLLEGNFINDPNYINEYIWYNPLLSYIYLIVNKLTGISAVTLTTQAGPFFNILSPILFYLMTKLLFNRSTAIAASVSFLFLNTGNLHAEWAATYSPWLFPANFVQSTFYLGIIVIFNAFKKPNYLRFMLAGSACGLAFLGHSAPTLILLIIVFFLFMEQLLFFFKLKKYSELRNYIKYFAVFSIAFIVVSMPLIYYVVLKYKLHMINIHPAQYCDPFFFVENIPNLIKENFSFSLVVSLFGIYKLFTYGFESKINRNILLGWLIASLSLFIYTTLIPMVRLSFGIFLPSIVPSFHFFFYLKSFQSLMFGIGFCALFNFMQGIVWSNKNELPYFINSIKPYLFSILLLTISLLYYPKYSKRYDFNWAREYGLKKNEALAEIDVYHWILKNTKIFDVFVCENEFVSFPIIATGRKLVATTDHFSNPYVSYTDRDNDRKAILKSIIEGNAYDITNLLNKYKVNYALLENSKIINQEKLSREFGPPIYKNNKFSIYSFTK